MKELRYYLNKALKNKFAIGSFNFSNMEMLQAIVYACKDSKSPAFISVSESALEYIGEELVLSLFKWAKSKTKGLFLHLDHGKSFELCKKAVNLGFDSVMIDGSALSFEENINLTKKVCSYAHKNGVLVEGELGQIKGKEDLISQSDSIYTSPAQAKEFVAKTGVDMLAISIGTKHGENKSKANEIREDILSQIEKEIPFTPLVLHGASIISKEDIQKINSNGGDIRSFNSFSRSLLEKLCTKHNIVKVNSDSDGRISMTAEIREYFKENPSSFNVRGYLGKSREKMQTQIKVKIKDIYHSNNKI